GALNYLEAKGLNAFSFLTLNIVGDDQNVFPYVDYDHYDRFDVSKLDQWEIVFEHADRLGLFLHFKTQEVENQGLLDNGGVGAQRKLYYRELIARFGHHLALNWNLGEESGDWVQNHLTPPQFTTQRLAMAQYFYDHDPYRHHIVIHNGNSFDDLLGPEAKITGPSLQTHRTDFSLVHPHVVEWIHKSEAAGKPWAVAVDEPGDAQHSLLPDKDDPKHDLARQNALWGALTAGAWGIEWYFGYQHDHSDLTCQDWRSRDLFWDQCKTAVDFFNQNLSFWEMESRDDLLSTDDFCFAKPGELYVVYLKSGGSTLLKMSESSGTFSVSWYNPRTGEFYKKRQEIEAASQVKLQTPKKDNSMDWVALVKRK
ncbi:MAG: putative collagen-binding domain-containing protein, partial [Aurantibacter sp.]